MKYIIITWMALLFSLTVQAQIVTKEEVEERAEEKTEQRVDQKIDQGIDKGLDAVEGLLFGKKKRKKNRNRDQDQERSQESTTEEESAGNNFGMQAMSKMFGGDVEVRDRYDFNAYSDVEVITTDKKGRTERMEFRYLFPEEEAYVGMEFTSMGEGEEMPPSFSIFDMEEKQMVTLIESGGQKMGVAISLDPETLNASDWEEQEEWDEEELQFRKTGRTKKILGYTCEEYVMEQEEGKSTFWVTDETDLHIGMAMGAMSAGSQQGQQQQAQYDLPEDFPQGAMLEMTFEDYEEESTMQMNTLSIEENVPKSVSTEGYTFMSMGGNKMGGK